MAGKTDGFEDALNNHVFGKASYTLPATGWFIALSTASVTSDAGAGFAEVTGNGYARQQLQGSMTSGSNGSAIKNDLGQITFPTSTPGGYGTILAVAIYDALVGGNMRYFQNLGSGVAVAAGQSFVIPTNALTITED